MKWTHKGYEIALRFDGLFTIESRDGGFDSLAAAKAAIDEIVAAKAAAIESQKAIQPTTIPPSSICTIPANIAVIVDACASAKNARFAATTGVQITAKNRTYRAVATDGRVLVKIEGPSIEVLQERTDGLKLSSAPKDYCVIPGSALETILTDHPNVTIAMGENDHCLTYGELIHHKAANVEGRFPPCEKVMPQGKPDFTMAVDAEYLARLAAILASLQDYAKTTLEFWKDDTGRIVLRCNTHEGQSVYGLTLGCVRI